ncbi:MAG: hypothetical protein AB7I41_21970 [Candidatus Sericytochromatia bacterium]
MLNLIDIFVKINKDYACKKKWLNMLDLIEGVEKMLKWFRMEIADFWE